MFFFTIRHSNRVVRIKNITIRENNIAIKNFYFILFQYLLSSKFGNLQDFTYEVMVIWHLRLSLTFPKE